MHRVISILADRSLRGASEGIHDLSRHTRSRKLPPATEERRVEGPRRASPECETYQVSSIG
jgi:hypothetical protein